MKQKRLQAHNQGGDPGRNSAADRCVSAAEIKAMHQHADDAEMADLSQGPRPGRARGDRDGANQHGDDAKAQGEKGKGLRVLKTELGENEAGAP